MKQIKWIATVGLLLGATILVGCAEEKPKTEKVLDIDVPGLKLEVNRSEDDEGTAIEIKSEKK